MTSSGHPEGELRRLGGDFDPAVVAAIDARLQAIAEQ